MRAVSIFGIAMLVSAVLVRVIRAWAERYLLDHPNERSSHTIPTPRGGGIAIVAVTLAGSLLVMTPRLAAVAGLALVIAAMSFIDDLRGLPAKLRLFVQIAVAFAAAWLFLPPPWVLPAMIWIVGLTNAYNFMDGIDGIAGGQAVVAGLGWALAGMLAQQPLLATLGLLLAGSSAGFLTQNWHPARIFMGDVGSAFLGFFFAALAVMSWPDRRLMLAGLLFVWPFVADAAVTFFRRLLRGERVMEPHKTHLYQRLHQRGLSHGNVAAIYVGAAAVGAVAALLLVHHVVLQVP